MTADDVAFTVSRERMFGPDYDITSNKTLFANVMVRDSVQGKALPPEVMAVAKRSWPALEKIEVVDKYTVRFVNRTPDVTMEGRSEAEALLLENQLIKSLKPRYNVLLRDDKSYPYVLLTQEPWPRIGLHRGARSTPGRYFGPYPSVVAVRETLNLVHKLFKLRDRKSTRLNSSH